MLQKKNGRYELYDNSITESQTRAAIDISSDAKG
jgi:hypothetical protein